MKTYLKSGYKCSKCGSTRTEDSGGSKVRCLNCGHRWAPRGPRKKK